jgi:hypothetical protein
MFTILEGSFVKKVSIKKVILFTVTLLTIAYAVYICFHYFLYRDYEQCLAKYSYEPGAEFEPLPEDEPSVPGMVLAAESDVLKLYTNTKTTEIAVYDKRTGEITWSNPPDRNADNIATGINKIALHSQFMVTYVNNMMTQATMYNFNYSVEREQYHAEKIDNGIRYVYLLGDLSNPTGIVPPIISPERLEALVLSKLDEKDARTIRSNYTEASDHPGFLELTSGIRASRVGLQKMNRLFEEAGYSMEDFNQEAAMASGGEVQEPTTFTVPLEYSLADDKLEVCIPTAGIEETGKGKIISISLLQFMGAGGLDEEGYILVPNGTGSLIKFNNGKKTERYNQYLYGIDETAQSYTSIEESEKARIPVFGIKKEKSGILAEITSGDALSNIIAMVSRDLNSYNYVYPTFTLRGTDTVSMFGVEGMSADLPIVEKDLYVLDLKVGYAFLESEDSSYSGMANYYRNQLIQRGTLKKKEVSVPIPFYLDIAGGVKRRESFLGVPYMGVYPMTRFDEAQAIVDALRGDGVASIRLNYLGWFNGGYYHDVAQNIREERVLGGRKGLGKLNESLIASDSRLYGDVAFQRISFESDHYNWRMETAQYYCGYVVALGRTNPATLRTDSMTYHEVLYHVLSPKYLVRHIDRFREAYKRSEIENLSLRDLGDMVPSDKRRSNVINREQSKQIILRQFEKLAQEGAYIMTNGGNAYSWAYSSDLANIPSGHNPFDIVDEEVPFYQMVVHGCIDYTGYPVNLSDCYDQQDILLRSLEYGMAPHFILTWQDSSEMKYTGLNIFYTTRYDIWLKDAVDLYHETNAVLSHVSASTIKAHEVLAGGVKRISYDNGCVLYINTSMKQACHGGVTIPARGYVLEGVRE